MSNGNQGQALELQITRIIAAPVTRVWGAWTNCEEVKRWWGPKGYISPECSLDLRVGGSYLFAMQAPAELGGRIIYTAGEYERILPGRSLEFSRYPSDKDGHRIEPTDAGLPPDFPREMHAVVEFDARGDLDHLSTELTLIISGWTKGPAYDMALEAWNQGLDKLIEVVTES